MKMTIEGNEKKIKQLRKELRFRLRNENIVMKEAEEVEEPTKKRKRISK